MRKIILFMIAASAVSASLARTIDAEGTEGIDMLSWARLQGRVTIATPVSSLRSDTPGANPAPPSLSSASFMGDYYLGRPASALSLSGFRATTGVLLGQRTPLWGQANPGASLGVDRRWAAPDASTEGTTPYLGLGYTSLTKGSGWRFSADMGLMSLNPGNILRMGRVVNGADSFDDMVRSLRVSRVLQVGVSYAF